MASPKPKRSAPAADAEELSRMPLLEHLEELRKRIVWSVGALAVGFVPAWIYHQEIFSFLERPIKAIRPEEKLIFLGITDPFFLYMKVAALAALFLTSPVVLYQFWRFVAPGLYRKERFFAGPFLVFGTAFFLAGGAFAYYVAFPFAAEFLLDVGKDFEMQLEVGRYFGLLMTMILGLGLMFELPLVLMVLAAIGVVTPRGLLKYFRHAVVVIFIVAAIITPTPDVVNLCVFALPTIGLYLLGVAAAWLVTRRRRAS